MGCRDGGGEGRSRARPYLRNWGRPSTASPFPLRRGHSRVFFRLHVCSLARCARIESQRHPYASSNLPRAAARTGARALASASGSWLWLVVRVETQFQTLKLWGPKLRSHCISGATLNTHCVTVRHTRAPREGKPLRERVFEGAETDDLCRKSRRARPKRRDARSRTPRRIYPRRETDTTTLESFEPCEAEA